MSPPAYPETADSTPCNWLNTASMHQKHPPPSVATSVLAICCSLLLDPTVTASGGHGQRAFHAAVAVVADGAVHGELAGGGRGGEVERALLALPDCVARGALDAFDDPV